MLLKFNYLRILAIINGIKKISKTDIAINAEIKAVFEGQLPEIKDNLINVQSLFDSISSVDGLKDYLDINRPGYVPVDVCFLAYFHFYISGDLASFSTYHQTTAFFEK